MPRVGSCTSRRGASTHIMNSAAQVHRCLHTNPERPPAYVMGVLASDTMVPTTKAAATVGMNQPGRTRRATATRWRPTRAGCRGRCCRRVPGPSAAAPLRTQGGQYTIGKPLVRAAHPAPRIPALATPLPLPRAPAMKRSPADLNERNADKRGRLRQGQRPVQVEQSHAEVDDDVQHADEHRRQANPEPGRHPQAAAGPLQLLAIHALKYRPCEGALPALKSARVSRPPLPTAAMRRRKRDGVHESGRLGGDANRGSAFEGGKEAG